MKGIIKSFLALQGYGYISGDDGKNYFFRSRSVSTDHDSIIDGMPVHFEERATQRGYEAVNIFCEIPSNISSISYELPDRFHIFRDWVKDGLEVLEESAWEVCGRTTISGESPEDAKDEMIERAKSLGANAIIFSRYNKGVGKEGTYKYRTHHFVGVPVVAAKRSHNGQYTKEQLAPIIDAQAAQIKEHAKWRNKRAIVIRLLIYTLLFPSTAVILGFFYAELPLAYCIAASIAFLGIDLAVFIWFLPSTENGWWLRKR
ncbi:hypothetical protein AGMMS50229_10360 [Campylobacterota bacterium]|nr:hypothetical protein AGMMS50229_10360 [Campylobacterota bacterium]